MTIPPFPWLLQTEGISVATLLPVAIEDARRTVPAALRILSVWPGWTLGGLLLTRYGPGSVLEYNELVACGALVRFEGRTWVSVTHVYVDSARSMRWGREGIGAPKSIARFHRVEGDSTRVTVIAGGTTVCTLWHGRPRWLWKQRLRVGAMHVHAGEPGRLTLSLHGNEFVSRIGLAARAGASIPVGSPLRPLGLERPLVGIAAGPGRALLGGAPFLPFRTISLDEID